MTLNPTDVGRASLPALYERLRHAIAAHPGVRAVGLVSPTLPPWDGERNRVNVQGMDGWAEEAGVVAGTHFADHGLLPMLGARMMAGRNLSAADIEGAPLVAVISASLARFVGGPERALGRVVRFAPNGTMPATVEYRVVGVVEDIAYDGVVEQDTRAFLGLNNLGDARASRYDVYFSLAQRPAMVVSIGVATDGNAAALIAPIRRLIGSIAPESAVHWTSAMDDEIALEYAPSRFYSVIVAMFSLSALLLTSIGLFALLSHAAAQRMSEMGLRLALGATPRATGALLLRAGVVPLTLGVAAGLVGAGIISRMMQSMLYDVAAFDTVAFTVAVSALLAVTLAAGMVPARRVARADPASTLRSG